MANEVQANYDKLGKVSSRFTAQAQVVEQLTQRIRRDMARLENGGWQGRGSKAFFSEMHNTVLPALARFQAALHEAAKVTKESNQRFQQAEQDGIARLRG
jgi:WXG100 family type VII secretion target